MSEARLAEKNHNWKGSVYIHNGYWMVYLPHWPINPTRIAVSRFIYSMMLGKYLKKGEVIHHINGDKLDDRVENLYFFASNSAHLFYHGKKNKLSLTSNLF